MNSLSASAEMVKKLKKQIQNSKKLYKIEKRPRFSPGEMYVKIKTQAAMPQNS
ncbi:MAG: hypothetical protein IJ468_13040 [Lachnospiraceae bacterium]|nr:hypothetical protein [Lachnospiraceae bacterium]